MNPATQVMLQENLKALKLAAMSRHLDEHLRQAKENAVAYEDFLLGLTEAEIQVRSENGLKRRMREARFALVKTFGGFDFEAAKSLDRRLIKELSDGEYIRERRNVIFVGKSGAGKTHLATALGVEACRQGVRTRFVSACGLSNELLESRTNRETSRVLQRYARYGLLIVDELDYVPFSREGAEQLSQALPERHERGSVVITTNLGFGDWTQVFGDANLTAALLVRLPDRAHIGECDWESYRLRETLKIKNADKKGEVKK
jgi:DNA replication protein DnaC